MFAAKTVIVIAVATLGAASPAELERRIESQIHMYAGDGCSGNEDYVEVFGSGTHECIRVPEAKRSYYVTGAECLTTLWTGTDCGGIPTDVGDSDCHNQLYGSISVQCS